MASVFPFGDRLVLCVLNLPGPTKRMRRNKRERVLDSVLFVKYCVYFYSLLESAVATVYFMVQSPQQLTWLAHYVPALTGLEIGQRVGSVTFLLMEENFHHEGIKRIDAFINGVCNQDFLAWVASRMTARSVACDGGMHWGNFIYSEISQVFDAFIRKERRARVYQTSPSRVVCLPHAADLADDFRMERCPSFISWVLEPEGGDALFGGHLGNDCPFRREPRVPSARLALCFDQLPDRFDSA